MDVSDLVQRYGEVPENLQKEVDEVWDHLQKQSEHIISKPLPTLVRRREHKASWLRCKGLIKPGYQISAADSWITNLNQCRSLFDGVALKSMTIYQHKA